MQNCFCPQANVMPSQPLTSAMVILMGDERSFMNSLHKSGAKINEPLNTAKKQNDYSHMKKLNSSQ